MNKLISLCLPVVFTACDQSEIDLERMLDQQKYEAYEASAFFEDGKIMRQPPPGTVPRKRPLDPALMTGLDNGEYLAELPVTPSRALLKQGQRQFMVFCSACHGTLGNGASQVAENMRLRPPPSLHEPRILAFPVGRIYRVISEGYGLMPSYSAQLEVTDRWAVVAYVQALQLSQHVPLGALPEALQEEANQWLK